MTEGRGLLAIAAGGAVGSLGRWSIGLLASGAVWATVLVNVTGALAMGLLVARLANGVRHPLVRPFVSVGLLGGWTTYSTFALDACSLGSEGLTGLLGYLGATIGVGLGAALLGLLVGDRLWRGGATTDAAIAEEEL